jgi:phosphomevalonate kinase
MRIKIKIQNKFYFWLKGKIKKKKQFNKMIKKIQKNKDKNWHKNKKILIDMWNWKEKII